MESPAPSQAGRWEMKAAANCLILAGSVLLLAACSAGGKTTSNDSLSAAYLSFNLDYVVPVADAFDELDIVCEFIDPETKNRSCEQLVRVLEERNPSLRSSIERLRAISTSSPAETGGAPMLSETIDFLDRLHALNESTVDAWDKQDQAAWRQSWVERDALAEEMDSVLEQASLGR